MLKCFRGGQLADFMVRPEYQSSNNGLNLLSATNLRNFGFWYDEHANCRALLGIWCGYRNSVRSVLRPDSVSEYKSRHVFLAEQV